MYIRFTKEAENLAGTQEGLEGIMAAITKVLYLQDYGDVHLDRVKNNQPHAFPSVLVGVHDVRGLDVLIRAIYFKPRELQIWVALRSEEALVSTLVNVPVHCKQLRIYDTHQIEAKLVARTMYLDNDSIGLNEAVLADAGLSDDVEQMLSISQIVTLYEAQQMGIEYFSGLMVPWTDSWGKMELMYQTAQRHGSKNN